MPVLGWRNGSVQRKHRNREENGNGVNLGACETNHLFRPTKTDMGIEERIDLSNEVQLGYNN
jgi:hypothetical protein